MQIKLLTGIVSDIAGKSGSDTLELLFGKKNVNEFLIAKKLKLTINQVRNILYKLSNYNLVTFSRKKDKRKGWYTYFWTLDNGKALELLDKKLSKELENTKNQIKSRESKRFYVCNTCKTEISEETALLHHFVCQECGQVYELADNRKISKDLKNAMIKIEKEKEEVLSELVKIKEIKDKKIVKELKKEERAKKKKLNDRRKQRQREKANVKKKKVKKKKKAKKRKRK